MKKSKQSNQKQFCLHRYLSFKDPKTNEFLTYQLCRLYFNDESAEAGGEEILEGLEGLRFKEKKDAPNNRIYIIIDKHGEDQSIALMFNENRKVLRHEVFKKNRLFTDYFLDLKNKIANKKQSWKPNDEQSNESQADEEQIFEESQNQDEREIQNENQQQENVENSQEKQLTAFVLDLSHRIQRDDIKQVKHANFQKLMNHKVFYIKKIQQDEESQENSQKLAKNIPHINTLHHLDDSSLIMCSKKLSEEQNCDIALFSKEIQKNLQRIYDEFNDLVTNQANLNLIGRRILEFDILFNNFLVRGSQTKESFIDFIKKKQKAKRSRFTEQDHYPNSLLQSMQCVYCKIHKVKQNKKSKEECGGCHVKFNIHMPFCMVGNRDCFARFHQQILPNLTIKEYNDSSQIEKNYTQNKKNKTHEMKKNKTAMKVLELNNSLESISKIMNGLTLDPQAKLIAKSMNEHFFVRNLKLIKLIADKREKQKKKPEASVKEGEVRPSQN